MICAWRLPIFAEFLTHMMRLSTSADSDHACGARRYVALAALNRRLASGEIDRAEYEEKRKLIGR
jgi:uncharacterized membrane protein